MKKSKFKIIVNSGTREYGKEWEAEDFLVREVDGYVEGKYGVHKIKDWNQWNVTDLYSGLSIATKYKKKECIAWINNVGRVSFPWDDEVLKERREFGHKILEGEM